MANNSVEFRVIVNADGLVTGLRQVTNFGNETQKTGKKARAAGDDVEHLNYKMNQGVVGASAAARSFSKLNQTIGQGNGGLVGAYATLAANAFAVSAAFNALRDAAQVEQLMQGLEFQGAKTGRTLSTVASSIQEITEGSLSASEAMRAAALGSSAGLSAGDLERLTQVATNASKVLGRNLPDSMDRIIKGVTKLEPELLDELGLMTKLTEASELYARQVGKSAAALTNFEKRRAFVDAIQREGELKFSGIETEVDVNQFDRLAAAFQNLTQNVLGFISSSSALGLLLDNLTNTYSGLAGAVLLFASTIRKQLLGSFAEMTDTAQKTAIASKNKADDLSKSAEQALASSRTMKEAAENNLKAAVTLGKTPRGASAALLPKFIEGTASESEQTDLLKSRQASVKRFEKELKSLDGVETEAGTKRIGRIKQEIAFNQLLVESITSVQAARTIEAESAAANALQKSQADKQQAGAAKEAAVANALAAVSGGKLPTTFKSIKEAVSSYNSELKLNAQTVKLAGGATGTAAAQLGGFQAALIATRTGAFAATTAVKTFGVALLTALPYLGALFALVSVVEMVVDKFFTTDADRAKTKALEELTQVTESTTAKVKEYNRTLQSNAQLGEKTLQANIIKANSLVELAQAYIKVSEASKLANKEEAVGGVTERTSDTERALFPKFGGEFLRSDEEDQLVKSAEQLAIIAPEVSKQFLEQAKAAKTSDEVFSIFEKTMRSVEARYKPLAESLENLKAQFRTTDEAQANLTKSLRPTTQFDEAVQGYRDLNSSLQQVEKQMLKSEAVSEAVSEQARADFDNILTGLGGSVTATLQPATQSTLRMFNDLTLAIGEVRKAEQAGAIDSSQAESKINAILNQQNSMRKGLADNIRAQLKAQEKLLADNQKSQILDQSAAALAQSELSVIQRRGVISVQAVEKQQKLQDAIVASQVSQLNLKLQLVEVQIRSQQVAILELEAQKKIAEEIAKQPLNEKKAYLAKIQANKNLTAAQRAAATSLLSKVEAGLDIDISVIEEGLASANTQAIILNATQKAGQNAVKAAANQGLSAAEKLADRNAKQLEIDKTKNALSRQLNEATENRRQIEARLNDIQSGGLNTLSLELDAIKNNATLRKKAIEDEASESIAALKNQQLRSSNDKDAVKILQDQIDKKIEIRDIQLSSLELQTREEIINKIGVKNAADALQIVQQTLEVYQRRVDLAKEVADQEGQIFRNRAEISILRSGGQFDERTRKAIELDVANIALRSAEEQYELRMQTITMEFALLKAQRELQLIELSAKEKALREQKDPASIASADIIKTGIDNIRAFDIGKLEDLQRRQAGNTLTLARQSAKIAGETFNNTLKPENFALTAAKNLSTRLQLRRRGSAADTTGIPLPGVPGEGEPLQSTSKPFENVKLSFMEVMDVVNAGINESMRQFEELSAGMSERLGRDFGPQGKIIQALSAAMKTLPQNFKLIADSISQITNANKIKTEEVTGTMTNSLVSTQQQIETASQSTQQAQDSAQQGFAKMAAGASASFGAIASGLAVIGSLLKATSDAKIARIDNEISAEQKRDGKSAESVSKITALEKRKEDIARKSFNTQKKLLIAQAVMSTAAGIAGALAAVPVGPWNIALASIIGAMGAAQVAIISGMQYNGGAKAATQPPSTISIGKRSDTVDLARGPSANAGGEVGFLRGSQGMGTNASNFRTIGSAYGGELMRGFGNRGFVVGEKGPEVITPETPINVTPANDVMGSAPVNATINIQALDASGVQDILVSQKGNIIKMLRDAANASGKGFLEDVNVNVYTRPNVNRL
jgi:hypothetical protein